MTLYGYARVSVREPEDKNLDLQGTWGLADHGAPVRLCQTLARQPAAAKPHGIEGPSHNRLTFSLDIDTATGSI